MIISSTYIRCRVLFSDKILKTPLNLELKIQYTMKIFHFGLFGLVVLCIIEDLQSKYLLVDVDGNTGNKFEGIFDKCIWSLKIDFWKYFRINRFKFIQDVLDVF